MATLTLTDHDIIQLPLPVEEFFLHTIGRPYFRGVDPFCGVYATEGETVEVESESKGEDWISYTVKFMGRQVVE